MTTERTALLDVADLAVSAGEGAGAASILSGVSFTIARGETLALVGESGCGKSVTAYALLRLLDPPLAVTAGRIVLDGQDLLRLSERELQKVRGKRAAMIFQEPMTALNPVLTVGEQVVEAIELHERASSSIARARACELFRVVGIPDAERRLDDYPHRLSGGMRQRVMIAMALACNPALLIADEPTTALDVTVQAQVLQVLRRLRERGLTIVLITHDLAVVAGVADRVAVMYAGAVVELAPVARLRCSTRSRDSMRLQIACRASRASRPALTNASWAAHSRRVAGRRATSAAAPSLLRRPPASQSGRAMRPCRADGRHEHAVAGSPRAAGGVPGARMGRPAGQRRAGTARARSRPR